MLKKSSEIKVVMYHYVREFSLTSFPNLKGLFTSEFEFQINYFLKNNYHFATIEECIAAVNGEFNLPKKSILLTFDDAFCDHFENVFPLLDKHKIQGCFFPSAKAILEKKVLEVNKIQLILSKVKDVDEVTDNIFKVIDEHRAEYELNSNEYYLSKYQKPRRFDDKYIGFIKNILQKGLPRKLNIVLINLLFKKYVSEDEESISHELYMTSEQLECMLRNNMCLGSHSYDHIWLNSLSKDEQQNQIELSLEFMNQIGVSKNDWIMCYPHGGFNQDTIEILKEKGCALAFSTQTGSWLPDKNNRLIIPRLDTNDFPKGP